MNIVIAGAGEVGTHLAKMLSKQEHNIMLIDQDEEKIELLEDQLDIMSIVGSCTSIGALRDAGVPGCDLYIAVNHLEDQNINSAILAKKLGAKQTICRVNNSEYLENENAEYLRMIGIDSLIYPEMLAGREIAESLKTSWLRQYLSFCNGVMVLAACEVPDHAVILNKPFKTGYFDHDKYRVVAIRRKADTIIPSGPDEIKANDLVYFITTPQNLDFVREQAGKESYQIKSVMFMGGSRIVREAIYCLPPGIDKTILERDREKCNYLADKFDHVLIINSDVRNVEILKEEGIHDTDAFVAATSNTEANILACLAAKHFGVKKAIAEVENIEYIKLAESLGIDTVINKKIIAASYIYQITLDADVLDVRNLVGLDAEVIEFKAKEKSKITSSKIKDLRLPHNVNIGGIVRDSTGYVVNGNTQIMPGDHVIVFCPASQIRKIETFFH